MELFNGRKFPSSYQTFKLHYDQMYQSEGARSVDIQAPGSNICIYILNAKQSCCRMCASNELVRFWIVWDNKNCPTIVLLFMDPG